VTHSSRSVGHERVLVYAEDAPLLTGERDANALISAAWEHDATWIALPVGSLHDDFFRLETRVAGHVVQKFINYGLKVAVVGNIDIWLARSGALRDLVYETNLGNAFWFVSDFEELECRLRVISASTPR
jgi:hypothetical protein